MKPRDDAVGVHETVHFGELTHARLDVVSNLVRSSTSTVWPITVQ